LLTLGDVEVRLDGAPLPALRSAKALAVLVYLAVTGRPHLRPALAGLLWSELPEVNAQTNLRKALSALRAAGGPHLTITRQSVALNRERPYWLDVDAFQAGVTAEGDVARLLEAVELYRGDFLEGFYLAAQPVRSGTGRARGRFCFHPEYVQTLAEHGMAPDPSLLIWATPIELAKGR
jgi:DNA-binding SARP family transcriptional activator